MGRVIFLHQVLCLLFFCLHFRVISSSSSLSTQLCPLDQNLALLQFRETFSISCDGVFWHYPKTDPWKKGTNCCSWDGVTCDSLTGHVIGLDLSESCLYGKIHSNSTLFLLRHLRKLNLAYNDFNSSPISPEFGRFTSLEHLNLSHSWFDGLVPSEISLLSSNRFQGQIPEVIGKFKSLLVLNISHNSLTGHIPSSVGNIAALESLDLSSNKLVGKIPVQLTSLTFLEVLNLSHNQLMGSIPQGKQFDTFKNDSYSGNLGLCGLPLSEKCSNGEELQPSPSVSHEDKDSGSGFDWKIIMMGYGCGLVFGLSMGYIVFSTGKPQWFVRLIEGDRHKKVRRLSQRHQGRRN